MKNSLGSYMLSIKTAESDSEVDAILLRYISDLRRDTPMSLEQGFAKARENFMFGIEWLFGKDFDISNELARLDELAESFKAQDAA